MERNRESRRASIVGSNGFSSRRHRTNSLRDSPDEDGGIELQESVRLRDRVKKDRDRERDLRERTTRSKRRRGERETSEESTNDEDDEDEENTASVTGVRSSPAASVSNHHHDGHLSNHRTSHGSSISQQHIKNNIGNNHHLQHRKSFPLGSSSSKVFRAAPVCRGGARTPGSGVHLLSRLGPQRRIHCGPFGRASISFEFTVYNPKVWLGKHLSKGILSRPGHQRRTYCGPVGRAGISFESTMYNPKV